MGASSLYDKSLVRIRKLNDISAIQLHTAQAMTVGFVSLAAFSSRDSFLGNYCL